MQRGFFGHTDSPLTETGRLQALERGTELKDVHFDAVYSSDLARAKHTAELIALERDLEVKTTELLRERNFGIYEGRNHEDVEKENKELFERYNALSDKERHMTKLHESVEGNDAVLVRFMTVLREIALVHPGETVMVASHGGIMRSFLGHFDEKYYSMRIHNTGWVKISCDGIDFKILETNLIVPKDEYLKTNGTLSLKN